MNQLRDKKGRIQLEIPTDDETLSVFENALMGLGKLDDYELEFEDKVWHHMTRRHANYFFFLGMLVAYTLMFANWLELVNWMSKRDSFILVVASMVLFFGFWGMSERRYVQSLVSKLLSKFTEKLFSKFTDRTGT